MAGERKKKYESGEGARYMTRKQALQYLQLSLKNFRKLCILKGIYPREPNSRMKAQKGKSTVKTLYAKKDIQFLSHEPLIWKLRDIKIFGKRMGRLYGLKDYAEMERQMQKHPIMTLDHIIKERFPTFIDALRDLDDCLTLLFLFSTFPSLKHVNRGQSLLCRRLTIEFMHACIQAKALKKVFVSIKGYYFQVELMGQIITWIMPHQFSFQPLSREEVDFRIMSTFVELYTILLGFTNFQLFHNLNLVYPPKLPAYDNKTIDEESVDEHTFSDEKVAALNLPLQTTGGDLIEDPDIDQFPVGIEDDADFEQKKEDILKAQKQKTLFKGLKVFLNREVPREPLVFALRCLGATVSWDPVLFVGSTFEESDETITHQIVDRPSIAKQYLSRFYVQPQWVFDSVNACELLPVEKYLLGATLPPHLSPFVVQDRARVYQPPEEVALKNPELLKLQEDEYKPDNIMEENASDEEGTDNDTEGENNKLKGMVVTPGTLTRKDPLEAKKQAKAEKHLKEKMVSRKHRKLFKNMVERRQKDAKEIWLLRKKRKRIDEEAKTTKKMSS